MGITCNKKGVSGFLKLTAILIVLACLSACNSPSPIVPNGCLVEWTKGEVIELYWEYKDEMNEVAEIVLACDTIRKRIIENYEFGEISNNSQKSWFSEDDWYQITDLFEKIRPYMIVRSLREGDDDFDVVWIDFSPRYLKDGYVSSSLYYFKNPETAEEYKAYMVEGETLEHLDGYWYIHENFSRHYYDSNGNIVRISPN
jgi:hypothetical protein